MNAISPISGAKGAPPAPREFPDTLLVDSTAYIVDVISEGEIEGWATPEAPAKSIFFDGVPLQNAAGDFNFEGVEFTLRTGTESQTPPKGFANVVNEIAVGLKVVQATPVVRTVTDAEVDAVQVKVGTPTLTTLRESGNLAGGRIRYAIDVQEGAGPWVLGAEREIHGKTTSGFERRIRVELPETRPVSVRVRRISDDSSSSTEQNDLFFISITEVIDAKLEYPGTAYVAISFPAETFGGRIPRRSYAIRGLKCLVPSNYNPATRAYSGIWDGTFVRAHTDNPAWAWYTALVDERWGLGERVSPDSVDKWALYAIGQYCDELVDDGKGGTEPRFTFNGPLDRQENAIEVLRMIASAFRGATYWSAGAVVPVADRPSDPVKLVTNANVEEITYSGVPLSARHTAAIVSCRDPGDNYAIKPTAVHDDPELIRRYGRRQRDVTLPFCTSDGEALRAAKWIVETDGRGGERASWRAGFDHAGLRPGDAVLLSDKHRIGQRLGGRVRAVTGATLIVLDSPIPAALATGLKIAVSTDVGDFVERDVAASTFTGVTEASAITLTAALPASVVPGAVWFATAAAIAPRRFKVLANAPEPDNRFTISAVEEDAGKWARVEQGIIVDRAPPHLLPPAGAPAAPTGLQVVEWARAQPGSRALPVATLGWNSPADPRIDSWQWSALEPAGAWTPPARVYTPSADIPLEGGIVDGYRFRVRAATTDGQVSGWAEIEFDPLGANDAPAPPAGLAAASGVGRNTVSWQMPEEADFRHVEVLVNSVLNSSTAAVLGRTASTSLPDEGLGVGQTRYYWARTVTHAETNNVSALAGPVSAVSSGVGSALLLEESVGLGKLSAAVQGIVEDVDGSIVLTSGAGGRIAGVAIVGGGATSEVAILADRFRIARPDGTGVKQVFAVGAINGVSQVGISGDVLIDGTLLARHIGANQVTADKINVTNLAAISANLGSIVVGEANIGSLAVTGLKIGPEAVDWDKLKPEAGGKIKFSTGFFGSVAGGATRQLDNIVLPRTGKVMVDLRIIQATRAGSNGSFFLRIGTSGNHGSSGVFLGTITERVIVGLNEVPSGSSPITLVFNNSMTDIEVEAKIFAFYS